MPAPLLPYQPYDFANRRHIGPSPTEMTAMLEQLSVPDLDTLISQTVPASIRQDKDKDKANAPPLSEQEFLTHMREIASLNQVLTSLIGQGFHGTITPPAILRNVLENPAWYTAYTPYQPEISQGRLEALLNFQTMVCDLTGLDIANASLLDEASAAAEAMTMAQRVAKSKAPAFFVDENCHPQNIAVLHTRAKPLGIQLIVDCPDNLHADQVFGAILQYPGTNGIVRDFSDTITKLHDHKAIGVIIADPLALCVLKEPGAMGADIAVGNTQRFGVPLGFGGPHAAYIACRENYARSLPGRLVGVSQDSRGQPAYRLSLQTREQHIRREKATSNVCTAQALLAVMASFYAIHHGPDGLRAIAQSVHDLTVRLAHVLAQAGFTLMSETEFFDCLCVQVGDQQTSILNAALMEGINLRAMGTDCIGINLDETSTAETANTVLRAFGVDRTIDPIDQLLSRLPHGCLRQTPYLTHDIFNMNRAETELIRYMRRLSDRDLALDRAMIPLGSCTMKLNATAELMPLSWPEFANIHPYAPKDQAKGYHQFIEALIDSLCTVTGYDAFSMQPNSGAQGEYAGLMAIAGYHRNRGDNGRKVCLIPMSAHGTNPASAQMVGWTVVPVASDENGDIDLDDFQSKAAEHAEQLAGCMITYPSTHGVFEDTVRKVCSITHQHGGLVYIDGANMNAMVGLARPGDLGGDVSHLNLHKTFAIPHGGGGPGMGPIGVKSFLAPFLPGIPTQGPDSGAVTAAQNGSASILAISYAYVRMMGSEGMTQASRVAILNANYVANRLGGVFDILYSGPHGRVAHECIIDTRPFADSADVTVEDIAKRLIDCGFHAPTMSWPVSGTLMVEPTESETKAELDRFCDAMLGIREEIRAIEEGRIDAQNNPLKNAPHTMEDLVATWDRPYSREQACFPAGALRMDKYWPSVNRVNNSYGDRNLQCTCPPMSDYTAD